MKIAVGEKLPNTILSQMTSNGPQATELAKLTVGKRVVLVGMPGAFTKTCTNSHLPSLIRNSSLLFKKGIDDIICIVVNDIHVTKAWGDVTGASKAGIKIFSDLESEFAIAVGLSFTVPSVGFFKRLQRIMIILDDNRIKHIELEEKRSECELTSGERILEITNKIFGS